MRKNDIRIGGFYINESNLFIREVIGDNGLSFIYRGYSAQTGEPNRTRSECLHSSFFTWAVRECTLEEKARCNRFAREVKTEEKDERLKELIREPTRLLILNILNAIGVEQVVQCLEDNGFKVIPPEPDESAEGG